MISWDTHNVDNLLEDLGELPSKNQSLSLLITKKKLLIVGDLFSSQKFSFEGLLIRPRSKGPVIRPEVKVQG